MLHLIFFITSALATAGVCVFVPDISPYWAFAFFPGGVLALEICWLLFVAGMGLFYPKKKPVEKISGFCTFMVWLAMDWLMPLARVRVRMTGKELLPDEPFVLVSNHISDFDPMTVISISRKRKLIYISKESNFAIPVIGRYIYHAGFLSIDRENAMRAMRTIKKASEMMVKDGYSVGIYPEGTRSRTGDLLEFKAGAFLLAKKAKAPVVLMTTSGTNDVKKNYPFRATRVSLDVIGVIDRETVERCTIEEICGKARAAIASHLAPASGANEEAESAGAEKGE